MKLNLNEFIIINIAYMGIVLEIIMYSEGCKSYEQVFASPVTGKCSVFTLKETYPKQITLRLHLQKKW